MTRRLKSVIFISIPFLVVFVLAEGIVRLFRIPALQDESYFFGFFGCPKYFQHSKTENDQIVYSTNPNKDIQQTTFNFNKTKNTYRIFTLGGSAAYGEPFGQKGSFSRWLENRLEILYSEKDFEVFNCARKGFGSVRVRNIFDEIVNYDPDLIIVYFGNNEYRDYHFHRIEINIEIRPFFKTLKRILDNSHIFRMLFHLFFKERMTSSGADTIRNLVAVNGSHEDVFSNHADVIRGRRRKLDVDHGGLWVSKLDASDITKDAEFEEVFSSLNWRNELPRRFRTIFEMNVRHMARKSKTRNIPIVFLTRVRNFYNNRDDRLLFDRFDTANNVLRGVCREENIPIIESLPVLLCYLQDEIGYNAFMDDVHLTLLANQILAKETIKKMWELRLIDRIDSKMLTELEEKIETQECIERTSFSFNGEYYALMGWQKLTLFGGPNFSKETSNEIVNLANKAISLNPDDYQNYLAYLLLGTYYYMQGNVEKVQWVLERMKKQYSDFIQ